MCVFLSSASVERFILLTRLEIIHLFSNGSCSVFKFLHHCSLKCRFHIAVLCLRVSVPEHQAHRHQRHRSGEISTHGKFCFWRLSTFHTGGKKTTETDQAVAAKQEFTVLQCTEKKRLLQCTYKVFKVLLQRSVQPVKETTFSAAVCENVEMLPFYLMNLLIR